MAKRGLSGQDLDLTGLGAGNALRRSTEARQDFRGARNTDKIVGFELSISSGDVVVAVGQINHVAVAGATLDANGFADGSWDVVWTGAALELDARTDQVASDVVLGSVTVATNVVTAVSLDGRGRIAPVSQDI